MQAVERSGEAGVHRVRTEDEADDHEEHDADHRPLDGRRRVGRAGDTGSGLVTRTSDGRFPKKRRRSVTIRAFDSSQQS